MKFLDHYAIDGKNESLKRSGTIMIMIVRMLAFGGLGPL